MIFQFSSGGMSNLLYYCALKERVETLENEPNQVLLRIYGPSYSDTEFQLEVFRQLASEKLGPSLYGTFQEGRLEEYLPSSPLKLEELMSNEISAVIARKIAQVHNLDVKSLPKASKDWLLDNLNHHNDFILRSKTIPPPFGDATLDSTKKIALNLMSIDFKSEIDYISNLINELDAPLVFSHNDLHQNNILLLHSAENSTLDEDRIVLIDFEYCSYNYRMFDIANYLSEWCFDYNGDKYPHFNASMSRFPSEEKQLQVLKHYDNHIKTINSSKKPSPSSTSSINGYSESKDDIDILLDEMQPFLMASNLFWAVWAIHSAYTSKIKFGYWVSFKIRIAETLEDIYILNILIQL